MGREVVAMALTLLGKALMGVLEELLQDVPLGHLFETPARVRRLVEEMHVKSVAVG
jgi:hypothetical protein